MLGITRWDQRDLEEGILSFQGDPIAALIQDPNRILEISVKLSRMGKEATIGQETYRALKTHSDMIEMIVSTDKKTVKKSIIKAMDSQQPSRFFNLLREIKALKYILPSLNNCDGKSAGKKHTEDLWDHNMSCGDAIPSKNWQLRLAGYLHDVGKVTAAHMDDNNELSVYRHERHSAELVEKDLSALEFDNEEVIEPIVGMVRCHMLAVKSDISDRGVRRTLKKFDDRHTHWREWLVLKEADRIANTNKPNYTVAELLFMKKKLVDEINREPSDNKKANSLMVSGQDVMNILGIGPGKQVGAIMSKLFAIVANDPKKNNPTDLTNAIKDLA